VQLFNGMARTLLIDSPPKCRFVCNWWGASVLFDRSSSRGSGSAVGQPSDSPHGSTRSRASGLFGRGLCSLREAVCGHVMRWGAGAAGCEPTYVGHWGGPAAEAHDHAEISLACASRTSADGTDHRSMVTSVADDTISAADRYRMVCAPHVCAPSEKMRELLGIFALLSQRPTCGRLCGVAGAIESLPSAPSYQRILNRYEQLRDL
jgi:hypothetical protein